MRATSHDRSGLIPNSDALDAAAVDALLATSDTPVEGIDRDARSSDAPAPGQPVEPSSPPAIPGRLRPISPPATPRPQRPVTASRSDARRIDWRGGLPGAFSVFCLVVGVICLFTALPARWRGAEHPGSNTASARPTVQVASVGAPHHAAARTKAIEQVEIFDRVQGTNPTLSDSERHIPEPDPATWRVLRLRMPKESGGLLNAKLARPLSWIERVGAVSGGAIPLDLPEMGAVGQAEVLAIEDCPPLRPGKGNVVTGTFAHEAGTNLVTVRFSGGIEPIGVTDNHPFWSEDRRDFIPVGRLREGERVRTRAGTAEVATIVKRMVMPGEMVYNLEVHGEHVYQVTAAGVLVHNDCLNYAKTVLRRRGDGAIISMKPIRTPQTGPLPGYPVNRPGQPAGSSFGEHWFHLENGILRDPAHPRGISIDTWLDELGRLNGIPRDQILDFYNFLPYL
jgi:Pretoxin HINT domain